LLGDGTFVDSTILIDGTGAGTNEGKIMVKTMMDRKIGRWTFIKNTLFSVKMINDHPPYPVFIRESPDDLDKDDPAP
jgi:hypothetical protein